MAQTNVLLSLFCIIVSYVNLLWGAHAAACTKSITMPSWCNSPLRSYYQAFWYKSQAKQLFIVFSWFNCQSYKLSSVYLKFNSLYVNHWSVSKAAIVVDFYWLPEYIIQVQAGKMHCLIWNDWYEYVMLSLCPTPLPNAALLLPFSGFFQALSGKMISVRSTIDFLWYNMRKGRLFNFQSLPDLREWPCRPCQIFSWYTKRCNYRVLQYFLTGAKLVGYVFIILITFSVGWCLTMLSLL